VSSPTDAPTELVPMVIAVTPLSSDEGTRPAVAGNSTTTTWAAATPPAASMLATAAHRVACPGAAAASGHAPPARPGGRWCSGPAATGTSCYVATVAWVTR
jgi:hypothetical protein